MAKKTQAVKKMIEQSPVPQNVCGECALGKWVDVTYNRDWQGKPILLTCPNREYQLLRREKACNKFVKKTNKE